MVGILEKLVAERGAPEFIRSDNGPEFVAREVREWIQSQGFKTLYIEPGAPWQNSYTESFNARFRDEFLNVELFSSKLEAKVLSAEHREKYNNQRPHSSLEGMTPGEFAARCLATLQPTAYAPQDSETNLKHEQSHSKQLDQTSGALHRSSNPIGILRSIRPRSKTVFLSSMTQKTL